MDIKQILELIDRKEQPSQLNEGKVQTMAEQLVYSTYQKEEPKKQLVENKSSKIGEYVTLVESEIKQTKAERRKLAHQKAERVTKKLANESLGDFDFDSARKKAIQQIQMSTKPRLTASDILKQKADLDNTQLSDEDKAYYKAKFKALQDLQMDPKLSRDTSIRRELMRKLAELKKEASAKGFQVAEEVMTESAHGNQSIELIRQDDHDEDGMPIETKITVTANVKRISDPYGTGDSWYHETDVDITGAEDEDGNPVSLTDEEMEEASQRFTDSYNA